MTTTLNLNGETIRADVITFAQRLEYEDILVYEGSDDDWEIFSINGGNLYVAYQQAGYEDNMPCDNYGMCAGSSCRQFCQCRS